MFTGCKACGQPLDLDATIAFCSKMCQSSFREVFGSEGSQYFGDDDEVVSEAERREATPPAGDDEDTDDCQL